ncbi:MAG TPA: hypothetical protein VLM91_19410 [Candidatus Methylomirabilis sp.]|nr:hypothetical protein [Candidatus Methylomirabilis sp.]
MPESGWRTTAADSEATSSQHTGEMVIVLDAGESIVGWNRAADERFHFGDGDPSDARRQTVYQFCWATPDERHAAFAEALIRGAWRGRGTRVLGGERIDIESTLSVLLDASGMSIGQVITVRDVTQRNPLESGEAGWIDPVRPKSSRPEAGKIVVPICASCKAMRDTRGDWQQAEVYVGQRFDVSFTHGMCPECIRRFYPGLGQAGLTTP